MIMLEVNLLIEGMLPLLRHPRKLTAVPRSGCSDKARRVQFRAVLLSLQPGSVPSTATTLSQGLLTLCPRPRCCCDAASAKCHRLLPLSVNPRAIKYP